MIGELLGGVYDGARGAVFLATHPRLWLYVLLPAIAAVLILFALAGSALTALSGPIAALAAHLPGTWAETALRLLAGVVLTIAGVSLLISVAALIAGPFNEMLSESIEERVTGAASPGFSPVAFLRDLVVGLWHALRRVTLYVVVMLALLALGIIVPVVGSALALVLGLVATARFASYDAYDAVWSRRRYAYREKVAYLRAHRWRTLGLGMLVGVVLVVPGLNVFGLAIGATGATLRALDVERAGTTGIPSGRSAGSL